LPVKGGKPVKDNKKGDKKKNDKELEQLIEDIKKNLLVEETRKTSVEDISGIMKQWLRDDKKI
jgi:hypothetical protein